MTLDIKEQLEIISKAWGRQRGYCFFPWINGEASNKRERIQGYSEGPAFHWPRDKAKILAHMEAHKSDDLYWCPNLFEYKRRQAEVAMDEHALWADLDEINPRNIEEQYRPTIAWETSPGRYQGLWIIMGGDIQNASWPGFENQRLTYYLGADNSGWDTTQLLRIPGWANHKPDRRKSNGGKPWPGRLLWKTGPRYPPDHFSDLPEVQSLSHTASVILETELERIDRHELYAKVKLKLKPHIREFIAAREVTGDRSEVLWQIERELADAGLSVTEIVAIVRSTVWNKFDGRSDELKRLSIEAAKAIEERPDEAFEEIQKRPETLSKIADFLDSIKPPKWLIQGLWSQASCGFIAGQPKSYKSWFGLDMALSIATGDDFLGHFPVVAPGPVLYIQEEDSGPLLKKRYTTIMESSMYMEDAELADNGEVTLVPKKTRDKNPNVDVMVRSGFVISDPAWLEWLDERLAALWDPHTETGYRAVILDPLMMMVGDVEDNKASIMTTKIFRPLKQLSEKYKVAIIVVHHMKKGDGNGQRGGQMMLGSVANHAWTEDSLYIGHHSGQLKVEVESKHAQGGTFIVKNIRNKRWTPRIVEEELGIEEGEDEEVEVIESRPSRKRQPRVPKVVTVMTHNGNRPMSPTHLANILGITSGGASKQLARAQSMGLVEKISAGKWRLTRMDEKQ